jgi:hypothetical protein
MRLSVAFLLLICVVSVTAQMRRRTPGQQQPNSTVDSGAYRQPAATMHGVLKKITSKDIIIVADGDQALTIDRTRKTKFFREGKEIKPAEIAPGSVLTIDVGHDPELNPLALNVMVDSGPIDSEPLPPGSTVGPGAPDSKAPTAKPAGSPNQ